MCFSIYLRGRFSAALLSADGLNYVGHFRTAEGDPIVMADIEQETAIQAIVCN